MKTHKFCFPLYSLKINKKYIINSGQYDPESVSNTQKMVKLTQNLGELTQNLGELTPAFLECMVFTTAKASAHTILHCLFFIQF